MPKKAEIDPLCDSRGPRDCAKCPEYETCDMCGRRVCKYISVDVDNDLMCIPCCQTMFPYNREELLKYGTIIYGILKENDDQ